MGLVAPLAVLPLIIATSDGGASAYDALVPGRWTVVSLNKMQDVDPCPTRNCSYSAVEGQSAVINDWCGAALATGYGTLGALVTWGGGHDGYFGSELYAFDFGT